MVRLGHWVLVRGVAVHVTHAGVCESVCRDVCVCVVACGR